MNKVSIPYLRWLVSEIKLINDLDLMDISWFDENGEVGFSDYSKKRCLRIGLDNIDYIVDEIYSS